MVILGRRHIGFQYTFWVVFSVGLLLGGDAFCFEASEIKKVPRAELVEVMRDVSKGYDPTATTNGARFQAEVMMAFGKRLVEDSPMLITPDDWFWALLEVVEKTGDEAPQYVQLAYKNRQHMLIDPQYDRVIRRVKNGRKPQQAFNVVIWWPKTEGSANQYSYRDTLSSPNLNVTNHRVITYRLLDFGDCFFFDSIKGLTGRPTTGVLGFLFRLIGEGRVVISGMAISEDGLQVARGTAKKAFLGVTTTVTISPDGSSKKDVPEDRADLKALDVLLQRPFEMDYLPWKWSASMDALIEKVVDRRDN